MPQAIKVDKSHIKECMIEMLSDMFGSDCIGKLIRGNTISVTVDDKVATVNVESLVSSLRCYFTATSTLLTFCLLACKLCCLLITFANSLDPDQDRQSVCPDLDPNCLPL